MNFTNLIVWAFGMVALLAARGHLDDIHKGILKAQAKLIYESRTTTWGTPKFL